MLFENSVQFVYQFLEGTPDLEITHHKEKLSLIHMGGLEPALYRQITELPSRHNFSLHGVETLTTVELTTIVAPFLVSISELADLISHLYGKASEPLRIRRISQNSPISVQMEGLAETLAVLRDQVIPWRKKHAQKMAELAEEERQVQIALMQAQVADARIKSSQVRVETKIKEEEAEKRQLETERMRLENEHMRLENEKLKLDLDTKRLELDKERTNLVLSIIEAISPGLSEQDKLTYAIKLLTPIKAITESPLELGFTLTEEK